MHIVVKLLILKDRGTHLPGNILFCCLLSVLNRDAKKIAKAHVLPCGMISGGDLLMCPPLKGR